MNRTIIYQIAMNFISIIKIPLRVICNIIVFPLLEKLICYLFFDKRFNYFLYIKGRIPDIARLLTKIDKDNRVNFQQLEISPVNSCCLKCKYCNHVNPLRKGIIPVMQIEEWFTTWSKKIVPETFIISGGEPLLHPEINKIIELAVRYWRNSKIILWTNGMLSNKITDSEILLSLKSLHHINITKHFDNAEYNIKLQKFTDILNDNKISFNIIPSFQKWAVAYEFDENGIPVPFHSDFRKAWKDGCMARPCVTLEDNKLYKCSIINNMQGALREGVLGEDWNIVNTYKPLTPEATSWEIFVHLYSGAFPQCSICPQTLNFVKPEEFTDKTIQQIRNTRKIIA
jgi:hypothetical protein